MCQTNTKNIKNKIIRVGSLNVRRLKQIQNEQNLVDDMQRYRISIMAVQETHLQGTEVRHIRSSDGKNKYELFYTGAENNSHHGVAIVTETELKPQYQRISNRISKRNTKLKVGLECFFFLHANISLNIRNKK